MKLKELSIFEFSSFANAHPLGSFHETTNYALFMSERGYDYDLIGMIDDNNKIVAASLIVHKKINFLMRFGYAPKGFLINYNNKQLLKEFTELIKNYYRKKNFAYIKINPEITIGTLDIKNKNVIYNKNKNIENTLQDLGYIKLEESKSFEQKIPKFNSVIKLKEYELSKISKPTRNKIHKSNKNGLSLIKGTRQDINTIYEFFKNKKKYSIEHYFNYYNAFNKDDLIDIFLVKVDFEKSLETTKEQYEKELEHNTTLVNNFLKNNNETNLRIKLDSDQNLSYLQVKIKELSNNLAKNKEDYIAGAITIKYKNRVYILISGYNKKYKNLCPNHFLHHELFKYYKKDYDFIELNGISGDFKEDNPYKGLDDFKLGFKPYSFEYIGEFDLVINDAFYKRIEENSHK